MILNTFFKTLFLAAFALLVGCSSPDAGTLGEVTPNKALEMVDADNAIIIDVRELDEWNGEHIPGAIHIPLGDVKNRLAEIETYKGQPIIMQCRSGRRSETAGKILLEAGFEDVSNLTGGILAWGKANLPVE